MKEEDAGDVFDPTKELLPRRGPGAAARSVRRSDVIPGTYDRLFADGAYPTQIESFDPAFATELRGTYGNRWKPSWSLFGHPRGGSGRHNGADLFGRPGAAIVSPVEGRLEQRPAADGDALGHRAWIRFTWNGRPFRFILGHLGRFEGADRPVRAGETIGYVGCSGNADYDGVCSADNACGLRSSHVHLMLYDDGQRGGALDPLSALGWRVRYDRDDRDVPCHDVVRQPPATPGLAARALSASHEPEFALLLDRQGAILTQLEAIERLFARELAADAATELNAWRSTLYRLLGEGNALARSPLNVDPSAPVGERVATFWALLGVCVNQLDSGNSAVLKDNVRRFLLHVAFWEGDELRARVQYGNGPARSFFQFEAHRAKDTLLYASQAGYLDQLAQVSGQSEQVLTVATGQLPTYGQPSSPYFPAGNLIEDLLRQQDPFGIYLARIAFKKVPAAIPTGNAAHAEYWYKYWKVTGGDPDQLKKKFKAKADVADQHIPQSQERLVA